jgi:NAD-dependent SIR2 family protein deacetylase
MNILLFTGAGASVELGIPTMRPMTEQLVEYLIQQGFKSDLLETLQSRMDSSDYDMEHLVEELDSLAKGTKMAKKWNFEDSNMNGRNEIKMLQQETEWFIQHVCERVQLQHARQLWCTALRKMEKFNTTIATTNYDRSIELAASSISIPLNDGFGKYQESEIASWQGFKNNGITFLKLHGSTHWYRSESGSVYKLRHPMALFGNLKLDVQLEEKDLSLNSAVVLPSREKVVRKSPYDDIGFKFNSLYREADIAFFIGSSLRDPEIKKAVEFCSEKKPTYIINPNAEEDVSPERENLNTLDITASQFLCSILPASLSYSETVDELIMSIDESVLHFEKPQSILSYLITAYEQNTHQKERCEAIEALAKNRVSLLENEIKKLLDSEDEQIQKFALGLIPDSPNEDKLTQYVQQLTKSNNSEEFNKEVQILVEEL